MIEAFFSLLQVWLTATTIVWHLLGCYHFCSVGVLFSFALTDFVELFFSSSSLPYDLMGCNYPSALKILYGLKVCEAFLSFAIEREILEKSENQWGRGKIWMTKSMRISEEEKSFFISSLPYWSSLDVDKEKLFTQNHLICLMWSSQTNK